MVADMVMAESVWYVCTKFPSSLKSQEISGVDGMHPLGTVTNTV